LRTVNGDFDIVKDVKGIDGVLLGALFAAFADGGVVVKGEHLAILIQVKCDPFLEIRSD
jgi:hypothetical protein